MRLHSIFLVVLLAGCCSAPVIAPDSKIDVDPRVLEACKDQVQPSEPLTFEGILDTTQQNSLIYKECKAKNDGAIILIKKFTNQKDK